MKRLPYRRIVSQMVSQVVKREIAVAKACGPFSKLIFPVIRSAVTESVLEIFSAEHQLENEWNRSLQLARLQPRTDPLHLPIDLVRQLSDGPSGEVFYADFVRSDGYEEYSAAVR